MSEKMCRFRPRSAAFLDRLECRHYVSERPDIVSGGDLVVIANCPSCGTHYKHEPPKVRVRARCGRCAAPLDLSRLRPYRIVTVVTPSPEDVDIAARHLPIGLDHPALATTIARNVARPAPAAQPIHPPDNWDDEDPLPPIAENDELAAAAVEPSFEGAQGIETEDARPPAGEAVATFVLWLATGAIAGTGASWTMGGTTTTGMAAGAVLGAAAGWGWLRWTSPK